MSESWIAVVPLPRSVSFAPSTNLTAESANRDTEAVALGAMLQPPHCCCAAVAPQARLVVLPLHFTAAMHAARVRKSGGMERLGAIHRAGAQAYEAFVAGRHEARLPPLPLAVISSNSAALDAAGGGFPWSHLRNGTPPSGLVRIAPELRYKAAPVGSAAGGQVVAAPPYGFVADRLSAMGRKGQRRPLLLGIVAKQVRTHIGVSSRSPPALEVGGSALRLEYPAHPILRGFVVIPYGTVHRCWGADASRTRPQGTARPLVAAFIGCLSSPTPWRQPQQGSLWHARAVISGMTRRPAVKVIDTCSARDGQRSFDMSTARSVYRRAQFCLAPPGDVTSTSRLFDAIAEGCVPVATSAALVLPFASTLPWDRCVVWHALESASDATSLMTRLRSMSLGSDDARGSDQLQLDGLRGELAARQRACAAIRDRGVAWHGAGRRTGCSAGWVGSELLGRLRDPGLAEADWAATLTSLREQRNQRTGVTPASSPHMAMHQGASMEAGQSVPWLPNASKVAPTNASTPHRSSRVGRRHTSRLRTRSTARHAAHRG